MKQGALVRIKQRSIGIAQNTLGIVTHITPKVVGVMLLNSEWEVVYFFLSDIEVVNE